MHSHGEVGRWQRSQTVFVNIGRCSARGGARGGQMVGPGAGWGLKPSTGVVHVVTRVAGCGVADWQGVGDFRGGGCVTDRRYRCAAPRGPGGLQGQGAAHGSPAFLSGVCKTAERGYLHTNTLATWREALRRTTAAAALSTSCCTADTQPPYTRPRNEWSQQLSTVSTNEAAEECHTSGTSQAGMSSLAEL
ncbi:hypothetical protein E2C01_058004 [Portunus trituberculatus]|uniref:Uncharacterized protein n=1 Tax=Portunus trituberculatus TaxID=210409 RepID=A0A5B7H209_PORTR|nr:hypothetical protein [Portunus trituberculatus]